MQKQGGEVLDLARKKFLDFAIRINAGTVPGAFTSKISNHHSTIINPSLAIPAWERAPKSGDKRGDCPWFFLKRVAATCVVR